MAVILEFTRLAAGAGVERGSGVRRRWFRLAGRIAGFLRVVGWAFVAIVTVGSFGSAAGEASDPWPAVPFSAATSPEEAFLVRHWTTQHGLPQNTVTCLAQTRDGYLWMGTRYGLVRYDGVRFAVFQAELNGAATEALDCWQLVPDPDGTLWILTRAGLVSYRRGKFEGHAPGLPGGGAFRVDTVAAGRGGGLWLGGPAGVGRYRDGRLDPVFESGRRFRAEPVTEVFEDREGRLWLQFALGGRRPWQRFDPGTGEVRNLDEVLGPGWPAAGGREEYRWESVMEDRRGRLWVGSPAELVCVEGDRIRRYSAAGFWEGRSVRGLREDPEGQIWVVTEGAVPLHRFDGERLVPMTRFGAQALEPDVRAVLTDREGNLWVGSGSAGLYRIQQRQLLSRLRATDSSRDEVFSVFPRPQGGAWLGTPDGVLEVGPEGTRAFREQAGAPGPRSKPVLTDRAGRIWLGVLGTGLARVEGDRVIYTEIRSPQGSMDWHVRALFEDREGRLWVGASCGLLCVSSEGPRWWTTADGLTTNTILGVVQTPDAALWIGTDGGGVCIRQGERWRTLRKSEGLLHDRVWPLAVESDGAVWLGTPLGLNRVRGSEIRAVTWREGLHDNLAYSLLSDGRGWYWSHCNRGIWRMRADQLNAVADGREAHVFCVSYDESDGMESAEGNGDEQPSAARLTNGQLWFPTTRGVVMVDPARLRDNRVPPLPVIETAVAQGRELLDHPQGGTESGSPGLRIGPGQGRVLELHYTAASFFDAERLRFRYRLVGHDEGWNEAGGRRVAYYTALPPGRYRFEVMAGNHHGYWSEAPATLDLLLEPWFFQTWSFRALVVLGLGALLALLHHRRVRYLRQIESLKHRETLESERTRIARDLHDDLGAGLAGIALQAELARALSQGGRSVDPLLDRVTGAARGLVDQLREVVWALNPACDTLENLVTFVSGFTEDFLHHSLVRCRLEVPAPLPRLFVPAEARHGLVLAVKEALANAVRHGNPQEVRLSLALEGSVLILEVQDDGTGFDVEAVACHAAAGGGARGGTGIANLHARLEALGGRCQIVSAPGQGTTVRFQLRLRLRLDHLPP